VWQQNGQMVQQRRGHWRCRSASASQPRLPLKFAWLVVSKAGRGWIMTEHLHETGLSLLFQQTLSSSAMPPEVAQRLTRQVCVAAKTLLQPKPYRNWREEQRYLARTFKQQGWKQRRIAEVLQVSPTTVGHWLKQARNGEPPARPPRQEVEVRSLSAEKVRQLAKLFAKLADESAAFPGPYPQTMPITMRSS
jgi:predicted transcriptional regulator